MTRLASVSTGLKTGCHVPPPWVGRGVQAPEALTTAPERRWRLAQQRLPYLARSLLYSEPLTRTRYEVSYRERSTDITSEVEVTLGLLSALGIALPRCGAVRDYLFEHPDMLDLVLAMTTAAREQFGPPAQVSLDVYSDPEMEDRYLSLYIRQQKYNRDVMDRIENLSAAYEGDMAGKSGWLLVTTDLRPPR